jgi:hypothetical protein
MTEDVTQASASSPPEQELLRGWRSAMFAPAGSGQRRRRGSDGARLAAALLTLLCCLLVIRYDSRVDRVITRVIHPPPRSITWLVTVVYQAGSFGVAVTLAGLALLARRWEIARDIGLSAAGWWRSRSPTRSARWRAAPPRSSSSACSPPTCRPSGLDHPRLDAEEGLPAKARRRHGGLFA